MNIIQSVALFCAIGWTLNFIVLVFAVRFVPGGVILLFLTAPVCLVPYLLFVLSCIERVNELIKKFKK